MKDLAYLAGYFDSDVAFPGLSVSPERVVTQYEMEFFPGEGETCIDGQWRHITPGTVLSVCPGAARHSRLPFRNFYIKIESGGEEYCEFIRTMPTLFLSRRLDLYRASIRMILAGRAQGNRFRVRAGFDSIFAALAEERARSTPNDLSDHNDRNDRAGRGEAASGEVIDSAMEFMRAHLREPCPLERVADAVHLSPVYFHTLFRRGTGETPLSFLTRLRIERAEVLLGAGDQTTDRIAEECGFSSETYFAAVFKKNTGMTPRAYRNEMMKTYWK